MQRLLHLPDGGMPAENILFTIYIYRDIHAFRRGRRHFAGFSGTNMLTSSGCEFLSQSPELGVSDYN